MAAPDTKARKKLASLGMTQEQIEARSGVPQQHLSAYLRQRARPSLVNAIRLQFALGIEVTEWLTAEERASLRSQQRRTRRAA